ncbi:hypothetical protein KSF_048860 [Reticulibacter mediterranei]|uniref:DUF4352 domain-containing protein n=1 Tax=Reticulibacter mediterranei TaxID=2778369 RepID=A0A8J3N3W5_9CHLR|nr:DUF4352 domain-containing protein [Reticulibacter mediterranei]GHO94838.1 hypothetical protein KSF_048860 [Reticulibacter mediterranei]
MLYKSRQQYVMLAALSFCACLLLVGCGDGIPNVANAASVATGTPVQKAASSPGQVATMPTSGKTATVGITAAAGTPIQSNGAAPIEIATSTPVPGGSSTSQQIVLKDRALVINTVSRQKGANPDPVAINIAITIKNTGDRSIQNQAAFFQLVSAGGDFFGQTNSSDNFYGSIASHTIRSGTITFQLPALATKNLRLMYRSEVSSEALLVPINA